MHVSLFIFPPERSRGRILHTNQFFNSSQCINSWSALPESPLSRCRNGAASPHPRCVTCAFALSTCLPTCLLAVKWTTIISNFEWLFCCTFTTCNPNVAGSFSLLFTVRRTWTAIPNWVSSSTARMIFFMIRVCRFCAFDLRNLQHNSPCLGRTWKKRRLLQTSSSA